MGFDFDMASLINHSLFHGTTLNGLSVATLEITNDAIATQSANTAVSIGYLRLGNITGDGSYNLSGTAQLAAATEYIGYNGTGTFTHAGGANTISTNLCIGYRLGSSGTYNLNGGTLILKSLTTGSGTAEFNFGGGTLQATGTFSTSLPMSLTGEGVNANINTAGYAVTLSGVLSGTGGLNKTGSGTLTLNALNSYSGDTTVNGGRLEIAGGIDPSGTSLIDVQSGTAALKTVNVNKTNLNISTAALATFEVVNGSQTIGAITGSGTTQLDAGASLTAASICQGTITLAPARYAHHRGHPRRPDVRPNHPSPRTLRLRPAVRGAYRARFRYRGKKHNGVTRFLNRSGWRIRKRFAARFPDSV